MAVSLDQVPAEAAVDDIEMAAAGKAQEIAEGDIGVVDLVDLAGDAGDAEALARRRPVERLDGVVLRAGDQNARGRVALQQRARQMQRGAVGAAALEPGRQDHMRDARLRPAALASSR